jgi:hypothetical protein
VKSLGHLLWYGTGDGIVVSELFEMRGSSRSNFKEVFPLESDATGFVSLNELLDGGLMIHVCRN